MQTQENYEAPANAPSRMPEIQGEISEIDRVTTQLSEFTTLLEDRLHSVLLESQPLPAQDVATADEGVARTRMGGDLRSLRLGIQNIAYRIQGMYERCEL
jgi:hypothetical protein